MNDINKIFELIEEEKNRQRTHIELIASENYVSKNVLKAQGSILTNKYAEGYPGRRYYGGCEQVDKIEELAIETLKKLFNCKFANVQPHSGSQANMAVYNALLNPGDVILGMGLNDGGHLTHGYSINFSGKVYKSISYGVLKETELIDYKELRNLALTHRPKLIVCGASSYSRLIDYKTFREIADEVGAYLFVDMAHIAGLVAAKLIESPLTYADVVTSTTHKTLRGPRGGIILTNNSEIAALIDKSVFPGIQGGPLMHVIAAKAVAFQEALENDFIKYQEKVIRNAKIMAKRFTELGYKIISGGTDNHLLIVEVKNKTNLTGKETEKLLSLVDITVNKNAIPFDKEKPNHASGIRLGTPAITTLGFEEDDVIKIVNIIDKVLKNKDNLEVLRNIKEEVHLLMKDRYDNYLN
ncbi:MAG: serine hydroxymethyltransferase [Acholeplasmatales bacterium]|jgi:glycine hydroxymethyltransferase|nr:serine hydroxymethyltransferase [Acholeplasmatales bacterium]